MNALTKPKPTLTLNQALSFLEGLVFEAVDEFTKQRKSIDEIDIARHLEHFAKARIVQYVRDRADWPSIATDDVLVSANDARDCYDDTTNATFRKLVDEALFKYFQTFIEDWELRISDILVRSHYIKGDDDEHLNVVRYRLPRLMP